MQGCGSSGRSGMPKTGIPGAADSAARGAKMNGLRRFRWVVPAAAVVVVLAACTSSASNQAPARPRATATASVPADEQAANGPLVGDPGFIPGEQSCAAAEVNAPWYPIIAPFEVHDSNRTHLYECAHFTGSISGPDQVFASTSPQSYITPFHILD